MQKIILPAQLDSLIELINFVLENASKYDFSTKKRAEIEVVMEEALVNIINYAYQNKIGNIEINCNIDNNDRFIVEIIDSGMEFNPHSLKRPDLNENISKRKIGGLGVFLIKKLVNDVNYKRNGNKNILNLTMFGNKK